MVLTQRGEAMSLIQYQQEKNTQMNKMNVLSRKIQTCIYNETTDTLVRRHRDKTINTSLSSWVKLGLGFYQTSLFYIKKIRLLPSWSKNERYELPNSLKQWLLMIYVAPDISLTFCIWDTKGHRKNSSEEHFVYDTRRKLYCVSPKVSASLLCFPNSTCIARDLVFLLWYSSLEQRTGTRPMQPITSLHEGRGPLVLNLK